MGLLPDNRGSSGLGEASSSGFVPFKRGYTAKSGSEADPTPRPFGRDPPPAGEGEACAPLQRRPLQLINPLLRRRFARRALVGVELADEIVEREIGLAARL
jgi:hypothetical protein